MTTKYEWRTRQEIEVCEDCLYVAANGAPTYDGYAESGHATAYAKGLEEWGDEPWQVEGGEGSFSWRSCDFCGDHLGGTRYTASLMQLHKEGE